MTQEQLNSLKIKLLENVEDSNFEQFVDTAFKNMETSPESVVIGCTELITESSISDISSAYILGSIAGIALCVSMREKG